jgi:outer membrane biosynthesis protein TonB
MSDFLDFYKREEQKRSMTEEQQLELHKKQKALQAKRFEMDDDDFYNETIDESEETEDEFENEYDDEYDTRINEGTRIPYRPNRPTTVPQRRPAPIPEQEPEPAPAPMPKPRPRPRPIPQPAPIPEEEPEEDLYVPPVNKRREPRITESSNNPALSRAYVMMNEMQKKIETAFYRYGMSGLEKINKHLDQIFEAIVHPKPKEIIKYVEKPVERIVEKPVYNPIPPTNESYETADNGELENNNEQALEPESTETPTDDEAAALKQKFIKMNEMADSSLLSNALLYQNEKQAKTANTKLAQIEANAQLLREKMDAATSQKVKQLEPQTEQLVENDSITPSEDLEIVDDPVVDAPVEIVKAPEKSTKSTKKRSKKK